MTDTPPTDDFAEVTVKVIEAGTDDAVRLSPGNTAVACSTPQVTKLYELLSYKVIAVEPPCQPRPSDVLLIVAAGNDGLREPAHPRPHFGLGPSGATEPD